MINQRIAVGEHLPKPGGSVNGDGQTRVPSGLKAA